MKSVLIIAIIVSIVIGIVFSVFLMPTMSQKNPVDEMERDEIAWQLLQKTYLEQECREQYIGQPEELEACFERIDEEQRQNPPIKPQESDCSIQCLVYDPVCGKDGITYSCGVEDAACHGIEIKHVGECLVETIKSP